VCARMINQNISNQLTGKSKELCAILPAEFLLGAEPQIRFVDNRRRLQAIPVAFAHQVPAREPTKLVINKRHQFIKR